MANFFQCCKIQNKEGDMKVKYKNRCGLCYFGKPMGEWQGTPICEECLSHRIVVTDEMRKRKPGTTPDRIDIPVMKSQGEWEWWQQQTREAVFNALDAANERLNQLVWREKKLKRALWLARAKRATEKADSFIDIKVTYNGVCNIDHSVYPQNNARRMLTCDEWLDVWTNVWEKCLKMAEKYK